MNARKRLKITLVGADSLRGREIKSLLSLKKVRLERIEFLDPDVEEEFSKLTQFQGEPKVIHGLAEDSLVGTDLVFLAADKKTNLECGILAARLNFQAIDLSLAFNDRDDIPIVVAGVNDEILAEKKISLVANPHPVTIILSHIFHLIIPAFGISKAVCFVLQPVSAFDESGIEELADQSVALLGSRSLSSKVFKGQIAFNFLSHTEKLDKDGFSHDERQIIAEIKRILKNPGFPLSLSMVQAPVFHTYSLMTYIELERDARIGDLAGLFRSNPDFKISPPGVSRPISSAKVAGKDQIHIGQIKKEESLPRSFWIWAMADNLTRGSALNAYEIARILFSTRLT